MGIVWNTSSGVGNKITNLTSRIGDSRPTELVLGNGKRFAVFFDNLINGNDFIVLSLKYVIEEKTVSHGDV